jgi:hypothetical protein
MGAGSAVLHHEQPGTGLEIGTQTFCYYSLIYWLMWQLKVIVFEEIER